MTLSTLWYLINVHALNSKIHSESFLCTVYVVTYKGTGTEWKILAICTLPASLLDTKE